MIKAKNKHTGVVSEFTTEEWENVQSKPFWRGVFVLVEQPIPAEIKDLEEKQSQTKK